MPRKTRYLVFVAVAGTHALVVGVFLRGPRILRASLPGAPTLTAFILTRPARLLSPVARAPLDQSAAPLAPVVEPITVTSPASLAVRPSGETIDWSAAARRAAAATLARRKRKHVSFGFPPGGRSAITLGVPSAPSPAHHAGESDRTASGEVTEWTSDRCYIISDAPIPWEPDVMKHARITRGGCLPPPGPDPGELFRSLPAYKKHHPRQ